MNYKVENYINLILDTIEKSNRDWLDHILEVNKNVILEFNSFERLERKYIIREIYRKLKKPISKSCISHSYKLIMKRLNIELKRDCFNSDIMRMYSELSFSYRLTKKRNIDYNLSDTNIVSIVFKALQENTNEYEDLFKKYFFSKYKISVFPNDIWKSKEDSSKIRIVKIVKCNNDYYAEYLKFDEEYKTFNEIIKLDELRENYVLSQVDYEFYEYIYGDD